MSSARRYTVGDVRRLAQKRTSNLYDTLFTRKVSAWITAAVAPFDVSPNLVTVVNFFVGIAGCGLIAIGGNPISSFLGVLLVHAYAVLDSVDGELARLLDRRSLKGMFLEDWSAYALMNAFPLAVSLYLLSTGASPAALVLAVLFVAIGRNVMPALRRAIAESDHTPTQTSDSQRADRATGWMAGVENHLLHQTNIRLVMTFLILIHLLAGTSLPLEVAFYAYLAALFAREFAILFMALRRDLVQRELQRLRIGRGHSDPGKGAR